MDLGTSPLKLPLDTDPSGAIRVGKTRVTLDVVVGAFKNGATCEEIVYQFPVLDLGDVYAVIGFYLKNEKDVELYLVSQEKEAFRICKEINARFPSSGIRQRLQERRNI